jgi:hypothetical protein
MPDGASVELSHELDELAIAERELEAANALRLQQKSERTLLCSKRDAAREAYVAAEREHCAAVGRHADTAARAQLLDARVRGLRATSFHRAFLEILVEKVGVDVCDALRQMARERVKAGG